LAERRAGALNKPFRLSLDRLGITKDAAERARVGREVASLARGPLPGPEDYETLLQASTAWVRPIPGRSLWILYRFDDAEVVPIVLIDRRPPRVE